MRLFPFLLSLALALACLPTNSVWLSAADELPAADRPIEEVVDALIDARLAAAGVAAAPGVDDAAFLRRATLDLAGRIPSAHEVEIFLASADAGKRAIVVDRLLASPDFAYHLRNEYDVLLMAGKGNGEWREWLLRTVQEDRRWPQIFREVMLPHEDQTDLKAAAVETPLMYTWDPSHRRHSIGGVRSVAFSPDGKLLAVGGTGQIGNVDHLEALARIEVFDWRENKRLIEHAGDKYKGLVERLEFSPGGDWLVAAGGDHEGFIKFLSIPSGQVLHQDKAPMHVHDFELGAGAESIVACGHGKLVRFEFKTVEASS